MTFLRLHCTCILAWLSTCRAHLTQNIILTTWTAHKTFGMVQVVHGLTCFTGACHSLPTLKALTYKIRGNSFGLMAFNISTQIFCTNTCIFVHVCVSVYTCIKAIHTRLKIISKVCFHIKGTVVLGDQHLKSLPTTNDKW